MSPDTIGYIGVAILLVLMFLRMPLVFAFGLVGFAGIVYLKGLAPACQAIASIPYTQMSSYTWSVMPLFILMGYIAMQTKVAEEFYEAVRVWLGSFRSGLAYAIVLGNTAFGAVSSSAVTSAVTFSLMTLPETRKYGYADSLTMGVIAGGSILSVLIPPSISFIVYGGITETSIGKLFIAGIIPGLLIAVLFIITIFVISKINPGLGPPGPKTTWRERIRAVPKIWAISLIFIAIIGGLYIGLFTPTEAGAVASLLIIIIGLARRKLNWQGFTYSLKMTAKTTGVLFCVIMTVYIFNLFIVMSGLTDHLTGIIIEFTQSPVVLMLLIALAYLILGCFMDGMAVMLITIPVFYPVVIALGGDPLTFGVVITLTVILGGLTPPYGMTVFILAGIIKDVPLFTIFKGTVPFVIAAAVGTVIIIFFPQLATWLPGLMIK